MYDYAKTCDAMVDRIRELCRKHPEALDEKEPGALFRYGLDVSDLSPSLAQAQAAFAQVKREAGR